MNSVRWYGPVMDPTGYGLASRSYVAALAPLMNVHLFPQYYWTASKGRYDQTLVNTLSALTTNTHGVNPIEVRHMTPDAIPRSLDWGLLQVAMTVFETDRLPTHWVSPLRSVDEVWTHSHWGAEVMRESGVDRHIHVIPHGVDVNVFVPGASPLSQLVGFKRQGRFVFGCSCELTERKNLRGLLCAWVRAFKSTDDVVLVIHAISRGDAFVKDRVLAMVHEACVSAGVITSAIAPVVVLSGVMADDELPRFYGSLDCYVLPSRGEGWSLTHSEAMSCGLPAIAVGWGGQTEFMNDHNSYLLKNFKLVEVGPEHSYGPLKAYVSHRWAEPDTDELVDYLRVVLSNESLRSLISASARQTMVEKFTWVKAAQAIADRVNEITR